MILYDEEYLKHLKYGLNIRDYECEYPPIFRYLIDLQTINSSFANITKTLSNKIEEAFCRSSRLEVFSKRDVLKNFIKFTRKHVCQSPFFNETAFLLSS